MGQISFMLDDNLEKKFRDKVAKTKGYHQGHIKNSLHEAIEDWVNKR